MNRVSALTTAILAPDRPHKLPIAVLYLTDGCNSRCITCDIWKRPRRNMHLDLVEKVAEAVIPLGIRQVALSGGEAMQHPEWPQIAARLRSTGARIMLITNGLALKKQADLVLEHIDAITVSLDAATPELYKTIRGVDALELVAEGIAAVSTRPVTTRTTIQRANYRDLPAIVDLAKQSGASRISFLGVDVNSSEAFGPRSANLIGSPALTREDLPVFAEVLDRLERDYAPDFRSGRIAESPAKLRHLYNYFAAVNGLVPFTPPHCNAPHTAIVIEVDGSLRPCYFLPTGGSIADRSLTEAIGLEGLVTLRREFRSGMRPECTRCVCPLYLSSRDAQKL
jgi:MoaA/NifB/PqqE/SkfB family radical SAM enzyme